MKYVKRIFLPVLLVAMIGCANEEIAVSHIFGETGVGPVIEIEIPSEVADHYGALNLELKAGDFEKVDNTDGSITIIMQQQSAEEISQHAVAMFNEFEKAVSDENAEAIVTNVQFNNHFSEFIFNVRSKEMLYDENFVLTEEILLKNALAYQIVNKMEPTVKIQYFDTANNEFIAEKIVP
ncbi:hypothetical protein [Solibacillus sp. FSL H8-0538]|uniref:hypothetical protein n=1 Tax=Solibacillus sp. FSL H8-0538 TaxID=2921400 RepID=UPI0030F75063